MEPVERRFFSIQFLALVGYPGTYQSACTSSILDPQRVGGILWWRASRVLSDYDLAGNWKEIIDEFPFFSFILADLHPHVLTIPFVLLILALGFNFFLSPWATEIAGFPGGNWLKQPEFWLLALAAGSLAFFNTWDFPIYVALVCFVFLLLKVKENGWRKEIWLDFLGFGLLLGIDRDYSIPAILYSGLNPKPGESFPALSISRGGCISG